MKKIFQFIIFLSIASICSAQTQWQDGGMPVLQTTVISKNQSSVTLDDNRIITTWADSRSGKAGIYAQKIDEEGNKLWAEAGLMIVENNEINQNPRSVKATDNGIIIYWNIFRDNYFRYNIGIQKIDENGNLLWGENGLVIDTNYMIDSMEIFQNEDGSFYLFYIASNTYYCKKILAGGTIDENWEVASWQDLPTNVECNFFSDENNGFFITYRTNIDITLIRINNEGSMLWSVNNLFSETNFQYFRHLKISPISEDNFFIYMPALRVEEPTGYEIISQKFDINGSILWDNNKTITENYGGEIIGFFQTSESDIIVVWLGAGIRAQKIDLDGNLFWEDDGILLYDEMAFFIESVSALPHSDGGVVIIAYSLNSFDGINKIIMQRILDDGSLLYDTTGLSLYENISGLGAQINCAALEDDYYCSFRESIAESNVISHQLIDAEGNFNWENDEILFSAVSSSADKYKLLSGSEKPIIFWIEKKNEFDNAFGQIFYQLLDSNGNPFLETNGVKLTSDNLGKQRYFDADYAENSEVSVVAWEQINEENREVRTQALDINGNLLWNEPDGIVLFSSENYQSSISVSAQSQDGIDEFIIAWIESSDSGKQICAQKIVEGNLQWGCEGVQILDAYNSNLRIDIIDDFLIAEEIINDEYCKIYAIRLDENGTVAEGFLEDGILVTENCYKNEFEDEYQYECISTPEGLVVAWAENNNSVKMQRIDSDGNTSWNEDGVQLLADESFVKFDLEYNNYIYFCWSSYTISFSGFKIQKYNAEGEVCWQPEEVCIPTDNWFQNNFRIDAVANDILLTSENTETSMFRIVSQLIYPDGSYQSLEEGIIVCEEYPWSGSPQVNVHENNVYICYKDNRSFIGGDDENGWPQLGIYAQKLSVQTSNSHEEEIEISEIAISNYPNPFNTSASGRYPATTICYSLPKNSKEASIEIFNIKGQKVKEFLLENLSSGANKIIWDGKDNNGFAVGSGVYFYKFISEGKCISTKKMTLIK